MLHRKATLTVLICAYNEEHNIGRLLASVLDQQCSEFLILERIVVIADGCTDKTTNIIRQYARTESRIELVENPSRLGKPLAFNRAKKNVRSDFLVSLDADILLAHEQVLASLLQNPGNATAGLFSGRIEPAPFLVPRSTFVHRAFLGRFALRSALQQGIFPSLDNLYSVEGKILALHKSLYENLQLADTPGTDVEMFAECKKSGLRFRYCPEALVYFYPPATWRDFLYQHIRTRYALFYNRKRHGLSGTRVYGKRLDLLKILVRCFVRDPFSMSIWLCAALVGDFLFLVQKHILRREMSGAWPYVSSTK